jgi:hypothetical protein
VDRIASGIDAARLRHAGLLHVRSNHEQRFLPTSDSLTAAWVPPTPAHGAGLHQLTGVHNGHPVRHLSDHQDLAFIDLKTDAANSLGCSKANAQVIDVQQCLADELVLGRKWHGMSADELVGRDLDNLQRHSKQQSRNLSHL